MVRRLILASNSPRRKQLMEGLDIPFEVMVLPGIDEDYPADTPVGMIAECIARKKAEPYKAVMDDDWLVVTADTTVVVGSEVLGKPRDKADAQRMLHAISGRTHQVVTGVCLTTTTEQHSFSVSTDVTFKQLSDEEIDYYIDHYKPFDKAGAYGIQEWIGYVGVTGLNGSYYNVMGLPVQRLSEEMNAELFSLKKTLKRQVV